VSKIWVLMSGNIFGWNLGHCCELCRATLFNTLKIQYYSPWERLL